MSVDSRAVFDGVLGTIIHCNGSEQLEILPNTFVLHKNGKILHIGPEDTMTSVLNNHDLTREHVLELNEGQWLMPGLVDTHIHACQYPNIGLGQDLELLSWLKTYTFPLEQRYSDETFAAHVYDRVVSRTLAEGTTCASYMATIHRPATEQLAACCLKLGQRALVGKTCMDTNSPEDYCETTDESIRETRAFVTSVQRMAGDGNNSNNSQRGSDNAARPPLVRPSVTPRFAVTCSERLLTELGHIATEMNLHVQSHLSENPDEISFVKSLFPEAASYTDVYRRAGLLGPRTVMAHCVHVEPSEVQLLAQSGTGVAHCPNSNITLMSGLCNVNRLCDAGVHVGLGTDVSGGNQVSILNSIRYAIDTSKVLSLQKNIARDDVINFRRAFYLATLGGARALDLQNEIGNFVVGKQFDALVVDLAAENSHIDIFDKLTGSQMVEKFVTLGGIPEVRHVFVAGRQVSGTVSLS